MYAVFMDYEYEGKRNTVVLGGSISEIWMEVSDFLEVMSGGNCVNIWEVDEDDLPEGYSFQTYYVSAYDPNQTMIGMS